MIFENAYYNLANSCAATSLDKWENGALFQSLGWNVSARIAHAIDLVINVVVFPLAILRVTFGSFYAVGTWNGQHPLYQSGKHYIIERTNHILIDTLGSVVSPTLANHYRDIDLAPYVIAARIAVILWGAFYWGYSKFY